MLPLHKRALPLGTAAAAVSSAQPVSSPKQLQTTNKSKVFWSPDFLRDLLFTDPSRSFGTSWAPVRMTGVKQIAGLKEYIASSKRHTVGRADSPQSAAKARALWATLTAILLVNTDSRFSFYSLFFSWHTEMSTYSIWETGIIHRTQCT